MYKVMKMLVWLFMILYLISPADACPGPIDDIILLMIVMAIDD